MYFEFCILGLMEMFLKLMDNVLAHYVLAHYSFYSSYYLQSSVSHDPSEIILIFSA